MWCSCMRNTSIVAQITRTHTDMKCIYENQFLISMWLLQNIEFSRYSAMVLQCKPGSNRWQNTSRVVEQGSMISHWWKWQAETTFICKDGQCSFCTYLGSTRAVTSKHPNRYPATTLEFCMVHQRHFLRLWSVKSLAGTLKLTLPRYLQVWRRCTTSWVVQLLQMGQTVDVTSATARIVSCLRVGI